MKGFLLKVLLFVLIIITLDFILGVILDNIQKECTGGDDGRIKYICEKDTSDILIFGSSRAHYHYNPEIITNALNLSCFNCGQNGMGSVFFYGLLQLICDHHKPRIIIMDIYPPYDLENNDNSKYLSFLRPYYCKTGIDSIFWNIDKNERYKMTSNLYAYNSRLYDLFKEYHKSPSLDYNGYHPLNNKPNHLEKTIEKETYQYDSIKIAYIEKIAMFCQKNKISLFFTSSPRYGIKTSKAFAPLNVISQKYHIPFLNYYNKDGFANNPSLFANQDHLNEEGANIFSFNIAKDIIALKDHCN